MSYGDAFPVGAGALLVRMSNGVGSFYGITIAIDSDATVLDVTVAAGAWVLLNDGRLLDSLNGLVSVNLGGNTVDSTALHLYIDTVFNAETDTQVPTFSVALAAPSANALDIANLTVAGNILTVATLGTPGLPAAVVGA